MTPEHPGFVEFVDAATGEVTRRVPAGELPESMAYAAGSDGTLQPVTRITMLAVGDRREIHKYGADGTLLETVYGMVED